MEERDFSGLLKFDNNRKRQRKEKKKLKKIVKKAYSSHKKVEEVIKSEFESKRAKLKKKEKAPKAKKDKSLQKEAEDFHAQARQERFKRLQEELEEDEKEIRRLSKKLGYNKRKSTSVPEIFAKEGLDGLWDVCEDEKRAELAKSEKEDLARITADDAEFDDFNLAESDEESKPKKTVRKLDTSAVEKLLGDLEGDLAALDESGDENAEDLDDFDDELDEEEEMELNDENSDFGDKEFDDEDDEDSHHITEDIYGRKVDAKTGKLIEKIDTNRAAEKLKKLEEESELSKEAKFQLTKQIRSILNRLNEGTLVNSVKTLTDLWNSNPRNDVKEIFYEVFNKAVFTSFALTDRLLIEYSAFLSLAHQLVSTDISAHLVEKFTLDFLEHFAESENDEKESKIMRNAMVFFSHLFNFKIIKASFLFELMDRLRKVENPLGFNLIGDVFTYASAALRRREAALLSAFVSRLQEQISKLSKEKKEDPRISYLVEDFLEIKGNKLAKYSEKFDNTFLDHFQKVLKGLTKKSDPVTELGFSVVDVLNVKEKGRWWVVGSAFNRITVDKDESAPTTSAISSNLNKFDKSLLQLAEKLKLKTDIRKTIFCTAMSATNVVDAFEKLLKLTTKNDKQGREVVYILFVCAMNEKVYNPFYSALLERFCAHRKTFKLTAQFAVWDKVKELADLKAKQRTNLAYLVADMIRLECVQLTVLKTVNFALMDPVISTFLKRLLFRLLVKAKEADLEDLFRPVVQNPKFELLSQGLQLFFEVNLKPEEDFAESPDLNLFMKRLSVVRSVWGRSL
ncbi:unnamed protein product [Bursaphelenchus xylophilus]|uniref:(pine wood nematode) hypothetical protein n=1 Tax=Bursaphelenchus xylophilus TaxID=6326 RepID=A0A1I7RVP3_BURXY|nr:unnamed protein product [Bursaphelenchus xylophilus]CAG9081961.1 unnamed protein product [Bursaphelenchus xylophilus]